MASIKELYKYLNKIGLCDQIHLRDNETVFYHWNRNKSDLIPTLSLHEKRVEQVYYSRSVAPLLYFYINSDIENDLTSEDKFVRDKRTNGRKSTESIID